LPAHAIGRSTPCLGAADARELLELCEVQARELRAARAGVQALRGALAGIAARGSGHARGCRCAACDALRALEACG
jgi:hypothetical protein